MNAEQAREVLELECKVRFIDHAARQDPEEDSPIDLYVDGFWDGVAAREKPRRLPMLRQILAKLTELHGGNPDAVIEGFSR